MGWARPTSYSPTISSRATLGRSFLWVGRRPAPGTRGTSSWGRRRLGTCHPAGLVALTRSLCEVLQACSDCSQQVLLSILQSDHTRKLSLTWTDRREPG